MPMSNVAILRPATRVRDTDTVEQAASSKRQRCTFADLRVVLVIETLIGFLQLPDYPFRVVVQDLPHSREVSLFLLQRVFSRC